ncbi:MAG: ABC transporter ATP-binding protein [Thermoplasmata archaeon]
MKTVAFSREKKERESPVPHSSEVIQVKDLVKNYGDFQAAKGISFSVKRGEIFGLIGPNGAGKTTTIRILSTLLKVTGGSVSIHGNDVASEPEKIRRMISYLPEDAGAYKNLTGREYLKFMASFFDGGEKMVNKGMEIADLGDRIDDKVDAYSKGMKRRLLVGRAMMIDPKVAILDEPTSGLDVINAQEVRHIIKDYARGGTTILLSSHNMLEVDFLCDRIALIDDGRIVEKGTPAALKERYSASNIEEVFTRVVE